ncbi:hypothetical protein GCM10009127_14320 [Alteraurantiacibacter aestuarii]|uniref:Uncharacterized protein n=1 Tax=Alteraurantiacibacter aestuarii TaxID=650004 RepID=A0A844ZLQ9_9SPHN|nr:hypothetical protein [Alteraurantiacibacter aestuarii]MXO87980.1 hypothetical protein [Alteraurantiacibacter aestuarii]
MRLLIAAICILPLAACDRPEPAPVQRIALANVRTSSPQVMLESPDTSTAAWVVNQSGQAIHFGEADQDPLITLDCRLQQSPPQLAIIRHAPARPGLSALFPVIGNGMRSRFLVDAKLTDGEWRWEATLPADDPQLDVFTGPRDITATLPGGGMLEIAGSRIPGEFVTWCRAGGQVMQAQDDEQAQASTEEAAE